MLRLPTFQLAEPRTVDAVVALLAEHGSDAMLLAGGTDLLPNMKHELFTPKLVVALGRVEGLVGVCEEPDGTLVIGAMTSLEELESDPRVLARAPALAQAAGLVSGPQLRRMGTLGGNVMLDTRCQWYNQTYFWRQALGFCLKKDGTVCHVVESGRKCVAAASNDTAPALLSLDATLCFAGPDGRRELPVGDLYRTDGAANKTVEGELLTEVRLPPTPAGHRGAYGKLRDRDSIDFPLLGIAARLDVDADERIERAEVCAVALQARPARIRKAGELLLGAPVTGAAFEEAVDAVAARASRELRPMENVPGDAAYRHAMVPVLVRRTLRAAAEGSGPVRNL